MAKTGEYLIEPLAKRIRYTFDPDKLKLPTGFEDRFPYQRGKVRELFDGIEREEREERETIAGSIQKAAANIAVRGRTGKFKVGECTDYIEFLFGNKESSAYREGFVVEKELPPKTNNMRSWLARYYDRRDLGTTSYTRQPTETKRKLAQWFCRKHMLDYLWGETPPSREELRLALRSKLADSNVYTNSQINAIFSDVEEKNKKLGTEEEQRRYREMVFESLKGRAESVAIEAAYSMPDSPRARPNRWRKGRKPDHRQGRLF